LCLRGNEPPNVTASGFPNIRLLFSRINYGSIFLELLGVVLVAVDQRLARRPQEEREMLPLCAAEGIGVIPWSPQARGRLTRDGDYTSIRTETDDAHQRLFAKSAEADRKVVDRVAEVAAARGVPRAQVALAWLLAKPVITAPIVGATKLHHLDDALASVNVKLSADEITSLEEPYVPHAVVGFV
jgi:aryl-alcohol dehydrogenase-like predicted oxidoreductase